jgi:hypothetical protein
MLACRYAFFVLALTLMPGLAAQDAVAPKPAQPAVAPAPAAPAPQSKPKAKAKPKAAASPAHKGRMPIHHLTGKEVELNGASKAALMKLPGITEAYADKIIAGRPYFTKAGLVRPNILTLEMYGPLKDLVVVAVPNQPRKK